MVSEKAINGRVLRESASNEKTHPTNCESYVAKAAFVKAQQNEKIAIYPSVNSLDLNISEVLIASRSGREHREEGVKQT